MSLNSTSALASTSAAWDFENELREITRKICAKSDSSCTNMPINCTEIPQHSADAPAKPMIAIDGSYSFLFCRSGVWLGLVRVCVLKYTFERGDRYTPGNGFIAYKLLSKIVHEKPVMISTNPDDYRECDDIMRKIFTLSKNSSERHREMLNRYRSRLEQETALKCATENKNTLISMDGALVDINRNITLYPEIAEKCSENGNFLIGVSKDSYTHAFGMHSTDEEFLGRKFTGKACYVRAPEDFERSNARTLYGNVYFARLHPDGQKWFRVDIGTKDADEKEVFANFSPYCCSPLCTGYPYPLLEAHRMAVLVRQFHDAYEDLIIQHATDSGMEMSEILRCLTHIEGQAAGAFHEYLDIISRE